MNEPRVVESVTNECQSLGRAHESSSARAEQLIACLEGEIAKRDEELAACRVAVENCEVFRARIAELEDDLKFAHSMLAEVSKAGMALRAELAAIKAQEPIGWYTEDHLDDKSATTYSWTVAERWVEKGWPVSPLYAAQVSEAKAQGVVQWPNADEIMQMAFEEGQPADDASGYYFELEEFDLFIERLMSEVASLNAAAPAAPAADAGLVEALGYQVLFDAIAAATSVYANGAVNISVQAFRESLAAHSAKGVV